MNQPQQNTNQKKVSNHPPTIHKQIITHLQKIFEIIKGKPIIMLSNVIHILSKII